MTACRKENYAAQWNDQDIACIGGGVANDTNGNDHRRQQLLRGYIEKRPQSRVDKTGVFGNTNAEHGDEHNADRMKMRKVRHHH